MTGVHERIPLDGFVDTFGTSIELSSVALGGQIISVSDEFFAEAFHLLSVDPAPSLKGQFGPKGALFSGWESRRHNPAYDWCIIKLGTTGAIHGFDIDTTHFSGNEAPEVSVEAVYSPDKDPGHNDSEWIEILPKVPLAPNSRHLFKIAETKGSNYVKLNMYPDGGIARFRVYGLVAPVFPADLSVPFDLAHVFAGGRVVVTSDQHFGVGSNLILPGRGKDMGDGWETKRSRQKGHKDWAILKLGTPGRLSSVEIDTAHFKGNFPESCELHALNTTEIVPSAPEDAWTVILPRVKVGPHKQHFFQLENVADSVFSHVKLTIHPDGGVKRIRITGTRVNADVVGEHVAAAPAAIEAEGSLASVAQVAPATWQEDGTKGPELPVLPLTAEAFAPFGQVVQAYADPDGAPRGTRVTSANQGTAHKFHKIAPISASYPTELPATSGISVFRCGPINVQPGSRWEVRRLERHPYTNQAFIPMGGSANTSDQLTDPGNAYLVIVALNGQDDRPDLTTMRAFIANSGQGIAYDTAVWHHPMAVLGKTIDFACIETQVGNGDPADCELVELDGARGIYSLKVPIV